MDGTAGVNTERAKGLEPSTSSLGKWSRPSPLRTDSPFSSTETDVCMVAAAAQFSQELHKRGFYRGRYRGAAARSWGEAHGPQREPPLVGSPLERAVVAPGGR
jgi:hypothetical protein